MKSSTFNISITVPHSVPKEDEEKFKTQLEHVATQLEQLGITKIREAVKLANGDIGEPQTSHEIKINKNEEDNEN